MFKSSIEFIKFIGFLIVSFLLVIFSPLTAFFVCSLFVLWSTKSFINKEASLRKEAVLNPDVDYGFNFVYYKDKHFTTYRDALTLSFKLTIKELYELSCLILIICSGISFSLYRVPLNSIAILGMTVIFFMASILAGKLLSEVLIPHVLDDWAKQYVKEDSNVNNSLYANQYLTFYRRTKKIVRNLFSISLGISVLFIFSVFFIGGIGVTILAVLNVIAILLLMGGLILVQILDNVMPSYKDFGIITENDLYIIKKENVFPYYVKNTIMAYIFFAIISLGVMLIFNTVTILEGILFLNGLTFMLFVFLGLIS